MIIENYERTLVEMIVAKGKEKGLSHSELARLAFGDDDNSVTKWRKIRNTSANGKPQRMTIADAVSAANVVGKNLSELCFAVEQVLEL